MTFRPPCPLYLTLGANG